MMDSFKSFERRTHYVTSIFVFFSLGLINLLKAFSLQKVLNTDSLPLIPAVNAMEQLRSF